MNPDTLYFRGLAGRWRPLPGPDRWGRLLPEQFHDNARQVVDQLGAARAAAVATGDALVPTCVCEVCRTVVLAAHGGDFILASPGEPRYVLSERVDAADLADAVGDHRHDDDLATGQVRWYRLRAIGPWKDMHTGSIAQLLAMDPKLTEPGWPVPPLAVINEFLFTGRHDAGPAGGLEFPPLQVDPAAYADLVAELLDICPGLVVTEVPEHITNRGTFVAWWQGVLDTFSPHAHRLLQKQVLQLFHDLGDHKVGTPGYQAAEAKYQAFMANILLVLERFADE